MVNENQFLDKNSTTHTNELRAHSMLDENDNAEQTRDFGQFDPSQKTLRHLKNELSKAYSEIARLNEKIRKDESFFNEKETGIANQRNELLKLLSQRDNTIQRKSLDITVLEKQLDAAVTAKFDALSRLDAVGGNELIELTHSFTNEQTTMMGERSNQRHKQNNGHSHKILQENSDNAMDQSSDVVSQRKGADDNYGNWEQTDVDTSSCEEIVLNCKNIDDLNSTSIQNELLSIVRTRRQSQFVRDAFGWIGSSKPSESVNNNLSTKNDNKVRVQKQLKLSDKTSNHRYPLVKAKKIKLDDKIYMQ